MRVPCAANTNQLLIVEDFCICYFNKVFLYIFICVSLKTNDPYQLFIVFFMMKETKRQTTKWKKIFSNDVSDKGLISKLCKNS